MIENKPSPNTDEIRSISVTALVIKTPTEELLKYFILKLSM